MTNNTSSPPLRVVKGNRRYASNRSIASSITFDDDDVSESTSVDVHLDPFLEGSFSALNDNQAIMPQRRQSLLLKTAEDPHDSRPTMPQRRYNSTSLLGDENTPILVPITEETLRSSVATADAPPSRPNRQQSVATFSEVSSTVSHGDYRKEASALKSTTTAGITATLSLSRSLLRGSESSDSTSSTATTLEPMPGYLQPAFSPLAIASKMNEMTQQAQVFQCIMEDLVADRKYGLRTFEQCFVGSEAVDRMLQVELAPSRAEAVELGRELVKYLGLFRHVTNGHVFKDRYLFYKFVDQKKKDTNSCDSDDAGKSPLVSNKKKKSDWKQRNSYSNRPWFATRMHQGGTIQEGKPME